MSIETVKAELSMAMANGWLTSIHMHDGRLIEYAEILALPEDTTTPSVVQIQTHRLLSGPRFIPMKKSHDLTISHIYYVDMHQDKPAPVTD